MFITVVTKYPPLGCFISSVQFLIFKNHLPICLPLFIVDITDTMHATCSAHLILIYIITLRILDAQYEVILANSSKHIVTRWNSEEALLWKHRRPLPRK
jgi:hypothetical protein